MSLQSQLFRGDSKLEAAAVSNPAHIAPGAVGDHVTKIQRALTKLDGAVIDAGEVSAKRYGPSTAKAVLSYKQKRDIINRSYQSQADDIVGVMTVNALDKEMHDSELSLNPPNCDFSSRGLATSADASARADLVGAPAPPSASERKVMDTAFHHSRRTLRRTADALRDLRLALINLISGKSSTPLSREQDRVLKAIVRWLKVGPSDPSAGLLTIHRAESLIERNLKIRTSTGAIPPLLRNAGAAFHAQADGWLNTDLGVSCGDRFFTKDGPNCRRDVLTHEWFHLIGVNHGGGRDATGAVVDVSRANVTTSQGALDSADHLAQLVSEVATGTFDSCPNR